MTLMLTILMPLYTRASPTEVLRSTSVGMNYLVEKIADVDAVPWGLAWFDKEHLLITTRSGTLTKLNINTSQQQPITGLPAIDEFGQGGLLDVAIPPSHDGSIRWIYFTYSKHLGDRRYATTLSRARLATTQLLDWQALIITRSASDSSRHFGSRIAFDGKGHLFFSIGDRGHRPNGQDLTTHAGSILRLNLDGSIPDDNPFRQPPASETSPAPQPEIWSYGHRNPQGLAFDPQHNRLWSNEHGPRGGDEINLIRRGNNYGWPITSHGKEYWGPLAVGEAKIKEGIHSPQLVYTPSIAPGSLLVYNGPAFPAWQGQLFNSALKLRHLNRVSVSSQLILREEERLLSTLDERIRALISDPAGWIYFSTDSGGIFRIRPAN
ncbi:dehydrogenase [Photobacterium aquae]|uniref:Dehydrogenase n=2 Tax=Photobacterium aquae TaxID=1195763 RepID=A0A0J1GYZ6_9GAMM|nr:dehydrogenase [Photobacterium aquae]